MYTFLMAGFYSSCKQELDMTRRYITKITDGVMRVVEVISRTEVGRVKAQNEDAILELSSSSLFAVADGKGGATVSQNVLNILKNCREYLNEIRAIIADNPSAESRLQMKTLFDNVANQASGSIFHEHVGALSHRSSSTLVAMVIAGSYAYIANVGNSRAYLCRNNEIKCLTQDHTVAMELHLQGILDDEQCEQSQYRKILTQAVGLTETVKPDFLEVRLQDGDIFFLCSDGLYSYVSKTLFSTLATSDLESGLELLVSMANDSGGLDNISGIAVQIGAEDTDQSINYDITQIFDRIFLFQRLNISERANIAPYLDEYSVPPGHVFCSKGDNTDDFFVIMEGRVRVTSGDLHLTDIGPGEHFGELSLIENTVRTAKVTAVTQTHVYALSRTHFQTILYKHPSLGVKLLLPFLQFVRERLVDVTARLQAAETKDCF